MADSAVEGEVVEQTVATQVWAQCRAGAAEVAAQQARCPLSVRDVLIAGLESFALNWAMEFNFNLNDPNDVKELARWLRDYLAATGRSAEPTAEQVANRRLPFLS